MNLNGTSFDPYCNKEFWLEQLGPRSLSELQDFLSNFEQFSREMEREFRFVMSAGRAEACRKALEELLRNKAMNSVNSRQQDLFG